jgi:hypothetical protein
MSRREEIIPEIKMSFKCKNVGYVANDRIENVDLN